MLRRLIRKVENEELENTDILSALKVLEKKVKNTTCCNVKKMCKETDGFREINGEVPPGELLPLQDSIVLLNTKTSDCKSIYIVKSIRKAGTRVGIHYHKYGGITIILKGEMTDFVQGKPVKKYPANTAYYMPSCTPMAAANLGEEDVELIDIFIGEAGQPFIDVMEPAWSYKRVGKFDC